MVGPKPFVPAGVIPACLLPFDDDFSIDEQNYRKHLRHVIGVGDRKRKPLGPLMAEKKRLLFLGPYLQVVSVCCRSHARTVDMRR